MRRQQGLFAACKLLTLLFLPYTAAFFWIPWCASWPFSASSVWCVLCCQVLKAQASSTAPGTAVVWHVCKHISTDPVSSRKARQHLHKHEGGQICTSLKGRKASCSSYTLSFSFIMVEGKVWSCEYIDWIPFCRFGFRCDFGFDRDMLPVQWTGGGAEFHCLCVFKANHIKDPIWGIASLFICNGKTLLHKKSSQIVYVRVFTTKYSKLRHWRITTDSTIFLKWNQDCNN